MWSEPHKAHIADALRFQILDIHRGPSELCLTRQHAIELYHRIGRLLFDDEITKKGTFFRK